MTFLTPRSWNNSTASQTFSCKSAASKRLREKLMIVLNSRSV